MCSADAPRGSATFFDPVTRCCTYEPAIPNYLTGRILRDAGPHMAFGKATVERRIASKVSVTPWGLDATRRHAAMYGPEVFGRAPGLRCPHYQPDGAEGTCGVWRHRNSVCSTWFCKHVRGRTGLEFWRSLTLLLREAEWSVGLWCVLELGAPAVAELPSKDGAVPASELGGAPDEAGHEAAWGKWAGREIGFYVRAAELADPLEWDDVERIAGVRIRARREALLAAYEAQASGALPEKLKLGRLTVLGAGGGQCTMATYSALDPLRIPEKLVPLLPKFSGGETRATLQRIEEQEGLRLSEGLVRKLVDFGLLTRA